MGKYETIKATLPCEKLNRKNEKDPCILIATTAALYVGKEKMIGRSLKVTKKFPWIDLRIMEVQNSNQYNLYFKFHEDRELKIISQNLKSFLESVSYYLNQLLPIYHPSRYQAKGPSDKADSNQFLNLFISATISRDFEPDIQFIDDLHVRLHYKNPIIINRNKLSDNLFYAMFYALNYSIYTPDLIIGHSNNVEFYNSINKVVSNNHFIKSLTLIELPRTDVIDIFDPLFKSIITSEITSLTFADFQLSPNMVKYLIETLHVQNEDANKDQTKVNTLIFSNTDFAKSAFQVFFENKYLKDALQSIETFSIQNDRTVFDNHQLTTLFHFLNQSNLKDASVESTNTDISEFFSLLAHSTVQRFALSKNVCSKNFSGKYSISSSIQSLDLSDVTWKGNSFEIFFKIQQFPSIDLNVANAHLSSSQWSSFFKSLNGFKRPLTFGSFIWSKNPLSVPFFDFLSSFTSISHLHLRNCSYPNKEASDIGVSLSNFLKSRAGQGLKTLNLSQTIGPSLPFLDQISEAIALHQSITNLNVAFNGFGQKGLKKIYEILSQNTKISTVNFDGAEPDNLQEYLKFLDDLCQIPPREIERPKMDMASFNKKKKEDSSLKKAWDKLHKLNSSQKLNENEATNETDTDISTNSTTTNTSVSNLIEPQQPIKYLNVSWNIDDENVYQEIREEWDYLGSIYSLENMTGLSLPSSREPKNMVDSL